MTQLKELVTIEYHDNLTAIAVFHVE